MLEDAKLHCDYLIVGLQTDPTLDRPDKTNLPISSRTLYPVKSLQFVDEIVPYATEQDLEDILQSFDIQMRI
jgi:glycerol-3-phosphate cytidylyltransferase